MMPVEIPLPHFYSTSLTRHWLILRPSGAMQISCRQAPFSFGLKRWRKFSHDRRDEMNRFRVNPTLKRFDIGS